MAGQVLVATFTAYNQAIWPLQIVLLVVAVALVTVGLRGGQSRGRTVYGGLAVLWAWCGSIFFVVFYARNAAVPAVPYLFGAVFLLQALLFARAAVAERDSVLALRADAYGLAGASLIVFALLAYPLIASALGQHFPAQPTFGAPCPLTIFTFGMLLLVTGRVPNHLLAIPFIWALLGTFPVMRAGILEDIGLIVAGLVALPMILAHNRRLGAAPGEAAVLSVGETPSPLGGTRRLH